MPRVNATFIEKLKSEFKHTRFSEKDFNFNYPDNGKTFVLIQFKYNSDYKFQITEEEEVKTVTEKSHFSFGSTTERKNRTVSCYAIYSPGEHKETEKLYISDIGSGIDYVDKWCKYLYSDLSHKNIQAPSYDDFRESIESTFQNIENENELFSESELIKVNEKFDELLGQFENLQEEWNLTQSELNKIKEELKSIKESAKVIPKGMWAKITNNKLFDIFVDFSKSKEGRELFIAGIKKLLSGF